MADSVAELLEGIARAEDRAGRAPGSVKLLPVSKTHSPERIRAVLRAHPALPKRLGENYPDELLAKRAGLADLAFEWHFIGRIQSRRLPELCAAADVLHTVARAKELGAIAQAARVPRFFLQVNVSGEAQKNGCDPAELAFLLDEADRLGLLGRCLGLMTLPAPLEDIGETELRRQFAALRNLRDAFLPGRELSMGMSGDYAIAIEEGADWIRVGTAIFGERQ